MENKYELIGVILTALALIVSILVFVFGNGVIWRGAFNDLEPLSTNMPTIGNSESDNSTENNSAWSSSVEDNESRSNSDSDNIKGKVWLKNGQNISDCPQVVIPVESQIANQTTYEMTWDSFDGATIYHIIMWKDANYETADSDIIIMNEVEVWGLSYAIDLTILEPGYTYGYNVVVDNHYSSPLLIELY